jgi:transcriptional regulator with XRE-family HTH domain
MFNRRKLTKIMDKKNFTAYKLWKKSGVAQSTISNILNNDNINPTTNTLQKLADALGVSVNEFFDDEDKTNDNKDKNIEKTLPVVPEKFTNPDEARAYVDKHQIFGSEGFDPDRLDDDEILEFANALLEQMKIVSYKYKK